MKPDMKFLVVDDYLSMRRMVKSVLNDLGYSNVTEADDGSTALPLLRDGEFDFLITDWNMPGMPGLDLLKAVRAETRGHDYDELIVAAGRQNGSKLARALHLDPLHQLRRHWGKRLVLFSVAEHAG